MTAPTRIGRYEIVRRLGKGMTDVYLAIDTTTNLRAALKLIPGGGDATTQLIIEAERRGAAIQKDLHGIDPRVVEIYEFGDCDGYFFVAMEYVEGRNLAEVLRADRALDPIRAATIALEICEQLAKFHGCPLAVVHGDIKPSNIHLGRADTVRLLDFGIAKALRADGNATSHHFGSPGYCSPERLNRSEVDQQSDLWAVGATLYEMLAGVPPFQAESTRKLERLIRSKRAPRALGPNCPRALRAVVTKALAPNPEQRYGSAGALRSDLQAFLERKPTVAEVEQRQAHGNSTIEAARACLRMATRTVRKAGERLRLAGAVGWFAAGMTLWIIGTLGWEGWRARRVTAAPGTPPAAASNSATKAVRSEGGSAGASSTPAGPQDAGGSKGASTTAGNARNGGGAAGASTTPAASGNDDGAAAGNARNGAGAAGASTAAAAGRGGGAAAQNARNGAGAPGTSTAAAGSGRGAAATSTNPAASVPYENLPQLYTAAAERIIESYRKSADPSLRDFDWQKAEVCLERAAELGGETDRIVGELALSRGYATLERLSGGKYSTAAAAHTRLYVRGQFALAAGKLPQSPDPHLALARVYVYWLPDRTKAMAEFAAAEKLGAVMGPREKAQKADAVKTVSTASAHRKKARRVARSRAVPSVSRRATWR